MHCYTCPDLVKEFAKYDEKPEKYIRKCVNGDVPHSAPRASRARLGSNRRRSSSPSLNCPCSFTPPLSSFLLLSSSFRASARLRCGWCVCFLLRATMASLPVSHPHRYEGRTKLKAAWSCDVGYERFLGPEIFFNPEIFSADFIQVCQRRTLAGWVVCCKGRFAYFSKT